MKYNPLLFPRKANQTNFSLFLLAMRLFFGAMLMTHGYAKLMNFVSMSASFPDPFGVGSRLSLMLAIFGELFCSVAFIFGFLYRLSMLPMMVTMATAFFFAHHGSVSVGELSFIYLVVFILMYLVGPGKYSIDYWMTGTTKRRR
ncbi:MAG: DoxX family protein [Paraprevotella sp.]|nr:DoxX family protein [Paraprevotella sp.]